MMLSLKSSPSMTCTPEPFPVGDSLEVMAWTPCNVPARTRYSFAVKEERPSDIFRQDRESEDQFSKAGNVL